MSDVGCWMYEVSRDGQSGGDRKDSREKPALNAGNQHEESYIYYMDLMKQYNYIYLIRNNANRKIYIG